MSAHLCYKRRVKREFSAGGVVVRRLQGEWRMAAIRPGGKPPGVWALPKGLIGEGESPVIVGCGLRDVARFVLHSDVTNKTEGIGLKASLLAGVLSAPVSVKASTNEGMGAIGRGEGIACVAVALVDTGDELPR